VDVMCSHARIARHIVYGIKNRHSEHLLCSTDWSVLGLSVALGEMQAVMCCNRCVCVCIDNGLW